MNNKIEAVTTEFTRLELHNISEKARDMATIPGLNPFWSHAYWALALAADHLDAMRARTTAPEDTMELPPVKEPLSAGDKETVE